MKALLILINLYIHLSKGFTLSMNTHTSTLIDIPLSTYGARCRYIIYEKKLDSKIEIVSPNEFGGLKSDEFRKINSHLKVPALIDGDLRFGESDTIVRYLLEKYSSSEPSFLPETLAERTLANQISRHHDMYIGPAMWCLYKLTHPLGYSVRRSEAMEDLKIQFGKLEEMVPSSSSNNEQYLTGSTISIADCAIFPTLCFLGYMLPFFDWSESDLMGPKLSKWFKFIETTETGAKIKSEMEGALQKWAESGRWDTILFAGKKDTAPGTVFDKIVKKEIPSDIVYEDDNVIAFKDINPAAPVHILIIPKVREGLTRLREATTENATILGQMNVAAAVIAKELKLNGFRLVVNDGPKGGQEIYHLHMHLLSGKQMKWPPG